MHQNHPITVRLPNVSHGGLVDYFKFKDYTRDDVTLPRAYMENQIAFLRRMHPSIPVETIRSFVVAEVQRSIQKPKINYINYPSYGNAELISGDLLSYTETIRKNIISPAGVVYMPPEVEESFLKTKILSNGAARKAQKKLMLNAANAGDSVTEQRANYVQSQIKIETNSIPGAFGSAHNCIFDTPNYNAVTGIARHCIMSGYAHVERMFEGNFYFPTLDHCINYCMQLVRLCPSDVMDVVSNYTLYIPSITDVSNHFSASLRYYMRMTPYVRTSLEKFITSLSVSERTFVYYGYCLKTLIVNNDHLFRPYLKEFFRTDVDVDASSDPKDIFKFNPDLLSMSSALNSDIINHKTVPDAVKEEPDGVRHLIGICRHMQKNLDRIGKLISTFLRIDCDVPDAMSHPRMIRKSVIISDTDSVIFSTQSWVEWYTGRLSFERSSYEINGFVVFFVIMTLEQVFARLSTNLGAKGEDIHRISMKNEFLYPVMMRTPLPKQYAGRAVVQEGFVLPKPKEDIKGLSFRNSAMCDESVKSGKKFVNWIFDTFMERGSLTVSECLEKVLDHELSVIRSLDAGERTFLATTPVREEYKNIDASIHYYWDLWQEVFKPNFGEFIIPATAFDIPILGDGKALYDERYLKRLREFDSSLYDRLTGFMSRNKRKITRLVVPTTLKRVPEILRPIINVRKIVYTNSTPFMVTMRSLGIGYTSAKEQILLSDIYTTKGGVGCSMDSVDSSLEMILIFRYNGVPNYALPFHLKRGLFRFHGVLNQQQHPSAVGLSPTDFRATCSCLSR